jgi:ATP-dependent Clp protease ATP-binding subunit ClpA
MSTEHLEKNGFDGACLDVFDSAQGLAEMTDHSLVTPAHMMLALLFQEGGCLDKKLRARFNGLRASTVGDSLKEILEMRAPDGDGAGNQSIELFLIPCSASVLAALKRARELANEWKKEKIPVEALACALLDAVDGDALEAFGDAEIGRKELGELAEAIAEESKNSLAGKTSNGPRIWDGDQICMESFGPVASEGLRTLTRMGEGRPLLGEDLLIAFLSNDSSRTTEALHIMSLNPGSICATLRQRYGEIKTGKGGVIERNRMGRMLGGILASAEEMARQENTAKISESHLMRAYVARVSGSAGNLLEKLGINPIRLAGYLSKYKQDREPSDKAAGQFEMVQDLEGYLSQRVIGQQEAIRVVVPALKRMRLGMNEPGRPLGVFLFLGATGVGKTELAKAVADIAFGPKPGVRDPYLIRIDCGKLKEGRDIVQLLGAPQGLVGYKEGALTNGFRDKGASCIVLFDEAEKAHPDIWQALLTFFDEGIVTEADGTLYDATGCILIATSNLGYKEATDVFRLYDISAEDARAMRPQVEEFVWKKVTGYFSPEFIGRFGKENVVLFNQFAESDYRAIVGSQVDSLIVEMQARSLDCRVDEAVVNKLVALAWAKRNEGARTVRRLIRANLRDPIVDGLGSDAQRTIFHFSLREDGEVVALDR